MNKYNFSVLTPCGHLESIVFNIDHSSLHSLSSISTQLLKWKHESKCVTHHSEPSMKIKGPKSAYSFLSGLVHFLDQKLNS